MPPPPNPPPWAGHVAAQCPRCLLVVPDPSRGCPRCGYPPPQASLPQSAVPPSYAPAAPWPYGAPAPQPPPAAYHPGLPPGLTAAQRKRLMPGPGTWWVRLAGSDTKVGLVFLAVGFLGVFLQQMVGLLLAVGDPILAILPQVVFGAPVFEEAFKFGLALALAGALRARHLALRIPLALLIGAGFGLFEHYSTYPEEDLQGFVWRVAFHAFSPSLSMVGYEVLAGDSHPATRWGATLAAAFVHYLNNFGAVLIAIGSAVARADDATAEAVGMTMSITLVLAIVVLHVILPLAPAAYRAVARLPVRFLARHI